jgi:uncharacterized protein YbaP (TraB family)
MPIKRSGFMAMVLALILANTPFAEAKSCLWKASAKEGTIYIQGSSHVLKAEHYPLAPAIETAYSNATSLVLEVDMEKMLAPETQQLIMAKAMLQPPSSLETLLAPATYGRLEAACAEAGLPLAAFGQFKPWFIGMSLALLKMQKMGIDTQYGLDKYFFEKAKADHKPVVGLETIEYQINLFDTLSEANPDDFVNRTLDDLKIMEGEIEKLLVAWQSGDIDVLADLLNKSFNEYPDLHEKFIVARNKAWAKVLANMPDAKGIPMVVVGAGHLPGKHGLLELLRQDGFTIEQL